MDDSNNHVNTQDRILLLFKNAHTREVTVVTLASESSAGHMRRHRTNVDWQLVN